MERTLDTKWRFLILEDNPDDVARVTDELTSAGIEFNARVAASREQFQETIREFTPDLVLSKYAIPSLDSMQAMKKIRSIHRSLPFIIVSEPIGEDLATRSIRNGATDFILKTRLEKLPQAVNTALEDFEDQLEREQDNALAYSRLRDMRSTPKREDGERALLEHARVLVLEDDWHDFNLVEKELRKSSSSITLLHVQNRQDYVRALMDYEPHIIISDFALPGFDGITALEMRNEICPGVPFILTSGILDDEVAVESLKHGVTDYVQKGVSNKLFFAVDRALSEAREQAGREQAEGNLKRSELMFRQLAENIGAALWIASVDLSKLFYVNRAYERIWGQSADTLYRKPLAFLDPIPAEDRARLKEKLKSGDGQSIDEHVRIKRPDGDSCWVWVRTFPISSPTYKLSRICGIAQDITQWKEAQLAADVLRGEREALLATYRQIFDAINQGIFVHDIDDGRVLHVNEFACSLYGYTREEIIAGQVALLSQGEEPYTQEQADLWLKKTATEGEQLFKWYCRDSSGRLFWAEVNLKRISIIGEERLLAIVRELDEKDEPGR